MNVSEEQKLEVRKLLIEDKKILAIKYLNENFGLGLEDAKKMAEMIEDDIIKDASVASLEARSGEFLKNKMGCIVGRIFSIVGFILLAIATIVFFNDQNTVNNGVLVTGTVISNPSQPVIEYEIDGQTYTHQSSVTSTPPSYVLGEEVSIYVDVDDPTDILIDTFSDRWLIVTILGVMGAIFFVVGIGVSHLLKKK